MSDTNKFKILIANQSPIINRKIYSLISPIESISVIGMAENIIEAMAIIKVTKPHAMILDMQQPGNNSIDLLTELQKTNKQIRVIIFTNRVDPYYKYLCLKFGADYFLDKSSEFEQLPEILNSMVREIYE